MDATAITVWGALTGAGYILLALWVERHGSTRPPSEVRDFYVLGWYALGTTALLASIYAAAFATGMGDSLLVTLRLGVTLAFVFAFAALLAAAANLAASAGVKTPPPARRAP